MEKEHTIKVIRGVHYSTDDEYIGERFNLITLEIDGVICHRRWSENMPAEPWLVDILIERMLGSDFQPVEVVRQYLLDSLNQYDIDVPTVDEIDDRMASFTDGWDAHKKWEAENKQS